MDLSSRRDEDRRLRKMSDTKQIRELYTRMYDGMVRKDEALLDEVLDDSFVLVHMTGLRQGKAVFICAVLDGTLNC